MAVVTRNAAEISAQLEPWLALRFGGDPRITGVEIPKLGASSETYLVDALIGGAERRLVLRVQASGNQVYQDPSVERQYRTMEALGRSGAVPVPALAGFEGNAAIFGQPFYLMERIVGESLPNDYHVSGFLQGLSVAARRVTWTSAVEAMARLHALPIEEFAFLGLPGHGGDAISQQLARWDAYREWIGLGAARVIDRARDWLEAHRPPPQPLGLAWGDARIDNLMFAGPAVVAVLDFETASLEGAEGDLGWWIFFDRMMTEGAGLPWLEGLGRPAELIETWEQYAGRKAIAMEWHVLASAWRFALIMGRARALANGSPDDQACWTVPVNLAVAQLERMLAEVC